MKKYLNINSNTVMFINVTRQNTTQPMYCLVYNRETILFILNKVNNNNITTNLT